MSAVLSGIKEVKEELTQSKVVLETYARKTILFLIRLNRTLYFPMWRREV